MQYMAYYFMFSHRQRAIGGSGDALRHTTYRHLQILAEMFLGFERRLKKSAKGRAGQVTKVIQTCKHNLKNGIGIQQQRVRVQSFGLLLIASFDAQHALIPIMISSIVPVVPKNTRGARDFLFIPTGIASNAPATENTQVPNALCECSMTSKNQPKINA
ncbi:hypothetical protein SDJN02_05717, partial [Cucurbita argyrosperma subsp. argyrosperma]